MPVYGARYGIRYGYGVIQYPYRWCPYPIRETAVNYTAVTVYGNGCHP
jgi:hypothetical protein